MTIEKMPAKKHYSEEASWLSRGLNPSPSETIELLENTTTKFLTELQVIEKDKALNTQEMQDKVSELVNDLPWEELDTEEREFLADVLAPAIESLGINPWSIF